MGLGFRPTQAAGRRITGIELRPLAKGPLGPGLGRYPRTGRGVRGQLPALPGALSPFPDQTFDTIIGTCVFCTVPDTLKGLSEARRVCRRDGRVLLLEHMLSPRPLTAAVLRLADPLLYIALGDHPARKTGLYFAPAGLEVVRAADLWRGIVWDIEAVPGTVRAPRPWPHWATSEGDGDGTGHSYLR